MSKKNLILVALAVISFFSGAIDQYVHQGPELTSEYLIETFITFFLVYIWYRLDSDEYGYSRSRWLDIAVIALTVVALPYYFFRSRGAKRGALASGLMLLAYITSFAISIVGEYAYSLCSAALTIRSSRALRALGRAERAPLNSSVRALHG